MMDVLDGSGEDGAFGLFAGAIGDDAPEFVDAFVDISASAAFDFFL